MYLKRQKKKDGRTYLTVVEGYRENGRVKTRHIRSLGYLDELKDQYDDPIAHFQMEIDKENRALSESLHFKFAPGETIRKDTADNRINVGRFVLTSYLYRDMDIAGYFSKEKARFSHLKHDPGRILEEAVWARLAHGQPCVESLKRTGASKEDTKIDVATVHEVLSPLSQNREDFVSHVVSSIKARRPSCQRKILSCSTTTHYLALRQKDRQNPPASPIIQLNLAFRGDGIPLGYHISDDSARQEAEPFDPMRSFRMLEPDSHVLTIGDGGYDLEQLIRNNLEQGDSFIYSGRLLYMQNHTKDWVMDPSGYQKSGETMKWKSRIAMSRDDRVTRGNGMKLKEIALWDKELLLKFRKERAESNERALRSQILGAGSTFGMELHRIISEINAKRQNSCESDALANRLDFGKLELDEPTAGYRMIVTNETNLSEEFLIDTYYGLMRVQDLFQVHEKEHSDVLEELSRNDFVETHFLLSFLTLAALILMQIDTEWQFPPQQITDALLRLEGRRIDASHYLFDFRNDVTDGLSKASGLCLNKRVLSRRDISLLAKQARKR